MSWYDMLIEARDRILDYLREIAEYTILPKTTYKPEDETADGRPFGSPYDGHKGMPNLIHPPDSYTSRTKKRFTIKHFPIK